MIGLLFLHGAGDTGHVMQSYLEHVRLKNHDNITFTEILKAISIKLITPTSSVRNYKGESNKYMNIWYDRSEKWRHLGTSDSFEDSDGIESSIANVIHIFF